MSFEKISEKRKVQNLRNFIQKIESLISEKKYEHASRLISKIKEKEAIFLKDYDNRKKHGVYYTDSKLTKFIIQKTLFKFINYKFSIDLVSLKDLSNLTFEEKNNIKEILLKTSICDPACGSGNFLTKVAKIVLNFIKELKIEPFPKDIKNLILKNIHGFDINPIAVSLSRIKLIRWFIEENHANLKHYYEIKKILNKKIQIKNSLIDVDADRFDIIIGNPPYGNILTKSEKRILKKKNIYYKDAYCAFLLRSLEICKGIVGFLVPKSFLLRQSYIDFRNKFLSRSNLLELYNIGSNEFKHATNEVQILIFGKKEGDNEDLKVYNFPNEEIINYRKQNFDDLRVCINSKCNWNNLAKRFFLYTYKEKCPMCSSNTLPLNRIRIKCNQEIFDIFTQIEKSGDLNYLNINKFPQLIRGEEANGLKRVKEALKKNNGGSCYYLDAKYDFQYFYFNKSQTFNLESISADILKGSSKEYYKGPKLLIKHNNIYPEALYTEENTCFTSSIYSLLHKNRTELKYLCALLNSAVIHFYCIFAINNQNDTTINLNQYMIRHLPIIRISDSKKEEIAELVDLLTKEFKNSNGDLTKAIKEKTIILNDILFNIYNIGNDKQRYMIKEIKKYNPFFKTIF
ncbi:MAG: hypothetical protein EU541_01010 [Promethearchaeota archaeon]|nr:MAG: hypothetical protein EU541_01010 [Candidatus Lokiarchaeota archaeon]